MSDTYLLLTPLLVLGVLALVRFIGCQVVFPLDPVKADPPENLTATPGNQQVTLSWSPVEDADAYSIVRGTVSGGPYPFSIDVPATQTSVVDTPLTNGVTQFYRIASVRGAVTGDLSDEVSATPGLGFITSTTLGTIRNDFTGFVGMVIRTAAGAPLTIVGLGRIFVPGNTGTHIVKIADGATGADLPNASVTVNLSGGGPANGFVYGIFSTPVTLTPNTEFLVISQETSGGDQWYDLNTSVTTLPVATVVQAVFGDGVAPFVRGGGPGNTYGPVDLLT